MRDPTSADTGERGADSADRAVSDVLGFVLIFSLVLTSTVVVVVAGIGGLEDAREAERVSNAERAVDVLADNIDDLAVRRAPARGTEFSLSSGTLTFGAETRMSVLVWRDGTQRLVAEAAMEPVVYDFGDERVVYEGTAVFRESSGGAAVVRRPRLSVDDEAAVVTLVGTEGFGASRGGEGRVLVRTLVDDRDAETVRGVTNATVRVRTTESRAPAWLRALEASTPGDGACSLDADTVECVVETETVTVTETTVDVRYEA